MGDCWEILRRRAFCKEMGVCVIYEKFQTFTEVERKVNKPMVNLNSYISPLTALLPQPDYFEEKSQLYHFNILTIFINISF